MIGCIICCPSENLELVIKESFYLIVEEVIECN